MTNVFNAYGIEVNVSDFSQEIRDCLAFRGLKEVMADAITSLKKSEMDGDEYNAQALALRRAKLDSLLAGNWTAKGSTGPRKVGIERYIRDEVVRRLVSKGKKMPTGKGSAETINGYVVKAMAGKFAESIKFAAQKRMEEDQKLAQDIDLDDFDLRE